MQNKPLQEFYKLIEQEQYRDALGVLESEEIAPQIADKWRAWLETLHKEDRMLAGVASPKQGVDPNQRFYEYAKLIGSILGMPLFTSIFMGLMIALFFNPSLSFIVPIVALGVSYVGWRWTVQLFMHDHINELSAIVWIVALGGSLFYTSVRFWERFDASWQNLNSDPAEDLIMIAVVCFLPFTLHMGWRLGEKYGLNIAKWWRPEMALQGDEKKFTSNE